MHSSIQDISWKYGFSLRAAISEGVWFPLVIYSMLCLNTSKSFMNWNKLSFSFIKFLSISSFQLLSNFSHLD